MAFEAFAERDYRRFWVAQFVSNVGSWMQTVAQGWLIYRLTDSPFLLGFVGFANSVPSLFLMLPAGVLADRLNRRRVVIVSQWAQTLAALFIAVAVATGKIAVWHIVVASVAAGTAISFSAPAWQAMVLDLLDDRSRLPNAVAMNSLQFQLSRVIGPLVAGFALSAYGASSCFLLNALSFIPLIWVLGRVKERQVLKATTAALHERLVEGFRFVRADRVVMLFLFVVAATSLIGFPYLTIMPMTARHFFGADDARGLGLLTAGVGAGSLAGALWLSVRTPRRPLKVVIACLAAFGAAIGAIGLVRPVYSVIGLLALAGFGGVTSQAMCNTSIQQRTPDDMRGRVMSMYTFAFFAFFPFGNLIAGALAEHHGLRVTMLFIGGGMLATAIVAYIMSGSVRRERPASPRS